MNKAFKNIENKLAAYFRKVAIAANCPSPITQNPPPSSQSGFTLIELSVVLVIISLIASAFLTLGTKQTEVAKIELTHHRLNVIEQSLGMYLLNNGHLPCPAVGEATLAESAYGRADDNSCPQTLVEDALMHVGTVPVVTLGLSDDYLIDGWNRRFTYVVDTGFVSREGFEQPLPVNEPDVPKEGMIKIFASEDDVASPSERTDLEAGVGAVLVLISHGGNGFGAWPKGGGGRIETPSTDAAEQENVHVPADIGSMDSEFTQAMATGTFDDIVRFKLRWQAIDMAGGIVSPERCAMIWRASHPINDVSTPKLGAVGCFNDDYELNALCSVRQQEMAKELLKLCFVKDPKT